MQDANEDAPRSSLSEGARPTAGLLPVVWTGGPPPLWENNSVGLREDRATYQCNGATDDGRQGLVPGFERAEPYTPDTVEPPPPPSGWNSVVPRNTGGPFYDYRQVHASQIRDENYSSQGNEGDVVVHDDGRDSGIMYHAYSNYQTPHAYSPDQTAHAYSNYQTSHAFSGYQASYEYSDYLASYEYSDYLAPQGYSNYPSSHAYSNYQTSHEYANYQASDRQHDSYAHGNTVWVSQSSEQQGHEGQGYSLHQGHEVQDYSGHESHEGQDYSGQQGCESQGHMDRGHANHTFSHQNYFTSPDEGAKDYTMKSLSSLDYCNPYAEVRACGLEPGGNEGHSEEVRFDKEVRPNPMSRDTHFSEQNAMPVDLRGGINDFEYRNPQHTSSWYTLPEPLSAVPVLGTALASSTGVPGTVGDGGQTSCVASTSDMNTTAGQSFSDGGQGPVLATQFVNGPGFNVLDSNYRTLNPQNTGVAGWVSVVPVTPQLLQPQASQTVVNTGENCQNLCWMLPGHTQVVGQGTVSNRPILPKVASVELVDPNRCSREEDNFLRGLQQQMVGFGSGVPGGYEFKLFKFRIGTQAIASRSSGAGAVPPLEPIRKRRRRTTRIDGDPEARTKRLRDAIKRHWRLVQMDAAGLLQRPACLYCGSDGHADVTRTDGFKVDCCGKMKCPLCDRCFKLVYCLRKHYCRTHASAGAGGGKSRVVMTSSQEEEEEEESNPASVVTLSSTSEDDDVDDDRNNDLQEGLGLSRSGTLGADAPEQEPP